MVSKFMKPCPFCGREVSIASVLIKRGIIYELRLKCECGVYFDLAELGTKALERWNERTNDNGDHRKE